MKSQMEQLKSNEFWNRITVFSFLLSVFIVCEHSINDTPIIQEGHITDFFNSAILRGGFYRCVCLAVPAFFMMSGMLLYRDINQTNIKRKLKSRFFSLIIPYLIWNTAALIFFMIISISPLLYNLINKVEVFDWTWGSVIQGIFWWKYNPVFWFIADLIIFTYLSPVFYLMLKNKYVGLFSIVIVYLSILFFPDIYTFLRGGNNLLEYMVGSYIGLHLYKYASLYFNRYFRIVFLVLFCLVGSSYIYFGLSNPVLLRMLSCIFLYLALSKMPPPKKWMNGVSMFIYATHFYIAIFISKIVKSFESNFAGAELLSFLFICIGTLSVCIFLSVILNRTTIYKILIGNRLY